LPPEIPFPLASGRYEVSPAMRRFGQAGQGMPAEAGHFHPDMCLAATLAAKLAALRQAPDECHLIAPDLTPADAALLRTALQEAFSLLAAEHPEMATVDADGVTLHHLGLRLTDWSGEAPRLAQISEGWPGLQEVAAQIRDWLASRDGLWLLGDALALSVQEDLAIVRGPGTGSDDVLEWLHVCLPSNWAPAEKIGKSFAAVHAPVAHNERLLASQAQIVRAMIHGGPFVRYVWAIHRDAELCHNPRLHQAPPWPADASPAELAERAYFRVERQTTHGFPAINRALFTIRYYVAPLTAVAQDPWRRERLASALDTMDEEALRYKGLLGVRDHLVQWLQQV
jgi:hypothetical protein